MKSDPIIWEPGPEDRYIYHHLLSSYIDIGELHQFNKYIYYLHRQQLRYDSFYYTGLVIGVMILGLSFCKL